MYGQAQVAREVRHYQRGSDFLSATYPSLVLFLPLCVNFAAGVSSAGSLATLIRNTVIPVGCSLLLVVHSTRYPDLTQVVVARKLSSLLLE